jgi:hypothetical protein
MSLPIDTELSDDGSHRGDEYEVRSDEHELDSSWHEPRNRTPTLVASGHITEAPVAVAEEDDVWVPSSKTKVKKSRKYSYEL